MGNVHGKNENNEIFISKPILQAFKLIDVNKC